MIDDIKLMSKLRKDLAESLVNNPDQLNLYYQDYPGLKEFVTSPLEDDFIVDFKSSFKEMRSLSKKIKFSYPAEKEYGSLRRVNVSIADSDPLKELFDLKVLITNNPDDQKVAVDILAYYIKYYEFGMTKETFLSMFFSSEINNLRDPNYGYSFGKYNSPVWVFSNGFELPLNKITRPIWKFFNRLNNK